MPALGAVRSIEVESAELEGTRAHVHPGGVPLLLRAVDPVLSRDKAAFLGWFAARKALFDDLAARHGAILFRGFALETTEDFGRAIDHYPTGGLDYVGGATARGVIAGRVFEATRTPKEIQIPLHQEMAYLPRFPRMIAFFSRLSCWAGGETILGDWREIERRLPRRIWDRVEATGVRYERNFRSPERPANPLRAINHKTWTEGFETEDPKVAEAACAEAGVEFAWEADGSLSTRFWAPGFLDHPLTGEKVWFNQALTLNMTRSRVSPARWRELVESPEPGWFQPYRVVYGDGGVFAQDELEEMHDVYDVLTQAFRWRDGDLMLVDNVNTAHGRNTYEGDRDLQVALLG